MRLIERATQTPKAIAIVSKQMLSSEIRTEPLAGVLKPFVARGSVPKNRFFEFADIEQAITFTSCFQTD
jgi:hypothetical protein